VKRREFLQAAGGLAAVGAGVSQGVALQEKPAAPTECIGVGVMGLRGRGGALLTAFAAMPDVEVRYVCDVDAKVLASRARQIQETTGKLPATTKDYRRALDDKAVAALVIGTPDHWHALPTIHACQAGKDVYVEKPDGHNVLEGRTMVAAARKYQRVVQLGTQARSGVMQREVMAYLAQGRLGKVRFAKAWESSRQGAIGFPPDSEPPAEVDYDLWLGPAPQRPFNPRRFHGSWRWFFDYGTGDLGNDGVHRLDVARWALETALIAQGEKLSRLPAAVSAHGGKYYFDDAQEWPDTLMVTCDYPESKCVLTYEMRIWSPYKLHDEAEGAAVCGDNGYVVIGNRNWRAFDAKGKLVSEGSGTDQTAGHVRNFLDCMRSRERPNADLETIGHPSSLLCHLGNAAWRVGRTLRFDAETYSFRNDAEANRLLTRPAYRAPWLLPETASL
jgi:predicted dehydrogenase